MTEGGNNEALTPFRVIEVRNNLKAKAKQGNGITPEQAIRAAEKRIQSISVSYDNQIKNELDQIHDLMRDAEKGENKEWLPKLVRLSHDLEGQAGVFNFILISFVCSSLSALLKMGDPDHPKFIATLHAHGDALTLIFQDRIMGDGGPGGRQLIEGLRATSMKVIGVKSAPKPKTDKKS
jgi:hypothetical protein